MPRRYGSIRAPAERPNGLSAVMEASTKRRYKEFGAGRLADYNPGIVDHRQNFDAPLMSAGVFGVHRRRARDFRVTLLLERGSAYQDIRGVMIDGEAEISKGLDATIDTMIEAMGRTDNELPAVVSPPEKAKMQMAGERALVRLRPQRLLSWNRGKPPISKTVAGLK